MLVSVKGSWMIDGVKVTPTLSAHDAAAQASRVHQDKGGSVTYVPPLMKWGKNGVQQTRAARDCV